jgi:uncharacterized protein YjbI with pentapeptide repeats
MKNILPLFLICLIFITSGCTNYRPSMEEATADGAKQLGKQNIKELVMNNELQMISWDKSIDALIKFDSNGKLRATNSVGDATHGRWSATADNQLCLKFKLWDDNRNSCYTLFKSGDQYLMFRAGVMENTLLANKERLSTLADMNVGVLGTPPPVRPEKTVKESTPAAPKESTDEDGSLLSAITFGLLGNSAEEIKTAEEVPIFIPEPLPVKKLSAVHQQLVDTGDCPGCDLQGLDLQGMNLKGANLAGANLEGANLQEANLKGANLKGTSLESARLTDAILIKADLRGTNLSDANLHWADLSKADLRGANLTRSYMVKAVFYKADLTGADFTGAQVQRTMFEGAEGVPSNILERSENAAPLN